MADLPILFPAPMVRAILREIDRPGTGKTQTRRMIKQPIGRLLNATRTDGGVWYCTFDQEASRATGSEFFPPHIAVGDRLYVREAWRTAVHLDQFAPKVLPIDTPVFFEADAGGEAVGATGKFRQGMHMPRWASRLTLEVTDVRVERLQEISEGDAIAEGLEHDRDGDVDRHGCHVVIESWRAADFLPWNRDPIEAYADLWDQLNHARGYGWHTNPWVAAYTFRPILGNIDQVRP